jgi:hypothetical protein
VQALGKLKGAHRLAISLWVRHAKSTANVTLGVGPLLGPHHHNASTINARDARNDCPVITGASIAAQLYKLSAKRLKQFGGTWSMYLACALHMTPRLGLVEVWPKLWRQVSITLVLENLVGTIRHLARRVGNGRKNGTDHCASTLRDTSDHPADQAHTRNRNLSIERHRWCGEWLQ